MEAVERIAKLAKQLRRGVITEREFEQDVLEVIIADRNEILDAERNGTLVTL